MTWSGSPDGAAEESNTENPRITFAKRSARGNQSTSLYSQKPPIEEKRRDQGSRER